MHSMTRVEKATNLGAVILPFAAVIAAIPLLWNRLVGFDDLAIMVAMYLLTTTGITIGYHRLLTHRSFQTFKPLEYAFAVTGSMAVQGPVNSWVADHRKHAHVGWLLSEQGRADWKRYAPDLDEDRGMRFISRHFVWLVGLSLLLPAIAGFALSGTLAGAATGLLWGGLVRIFFVHHITWSINSVCHFTGTRRFATDDESTNVFWLALPSLGEAWHHNHHAFPRSAVHGLKRWELDPSALMIAAMEKFGLARNVIRIAPERQAQKAAEA